MSLFLASGNAYQWVADVWYVHKNVFNGQTSLLDVFKLLFSVNFFFLVSSCVILLISLNIYFQKCIN